MHRSQRRYDIDWWRVIAILAVYVHHVCMPFNGDHYHIMNGESSMVLDDVMVFFEQIRLPLLFLISGTGTIYAFSKRTWWQFVKERSYRLLVPLIFGVLVIVPPQTYFERIEAFSSLGEVYAKLGSHLEVNHLWFIENLFYISLFSVPIVLFFRSERSARLRKTIVCFGSTRYNIVFWAIPLMLIRVCSKIYFPDDSKNILNLSSTLFYGYFFLSGIILASCPQLWESLKRYRKTNLWLGMIAVTLFYAYYFLPDAIASHYWGIATRWSIWHTVSSWVSWSVIIALLGYGQVWFVRPSGILKQANEAIYPFYILHQTVIIVLAYYIVQIDASIPLKIVLLLVTTFPITVILYRVVVYPFKLTRMLFGMKNTWKTEVRKTTRTDNRNRMKHSKMHNKSR